MNTVPIVNYTPDFFITNKEKCLQNIEKDWNQIPLLNTVNIDKLKDNCLIRFRGMVQDMHTPEYYLEAYEVVNCTTNQTDMRYGKYRDVNSFSENEKLNFDSQNNVNQERQTMFIVTMPGLNDWVQTLEKEQTQFFQDENTSSSSQPTTKRKIEVESASDTMETESIEPLPQNGTSNSDRLNNSANENKRTCTTNSDNDNRKTLSPEFILNFPLPDRPGKACLVKVYENYDSIKLNEMIEVVGFLSVDPILGTLSFNPNEDDEMDVEIQALHPPPSLIPRIHVVSFKTLKHNNPLLKEISPLIEQKVTDIRNQLHLVLTQLLLGDKLAADYLICHLISTVYLRKDVISLGQFSLNISNIPSIRYPEYGKQLYDILELFVTKSYYLAMSLDNMNTLSFLPKKDYDCNRLTSGLLQLSPHTHLVVDETRLQPGRLDQMGVANVAALANVMRTQKANYDFKFYPVEYDTNIPILVLSEGRSMLPSDCHVSVVPDSICENTIVEIMDAARHYLQQQVLNDIRIYITTMKHSDCDLTDDVQTLVQQDFVSMRQNDQSVTADDLHKLLVLTRLVALSHGKSVVEKESWIMAMKMESERKSRLPQRRT